MSNFLLEELISLLEYRCLINRGAEFLENLRYFKMSNKPVYFEMRLIFNFFSLSYIYYRNSSMARADAEEILWFPETGQAQCLF